MSITYRPASEADQAKIKALIRQVKINPMGLKWQRFIVAEDAGEFVGCVQVKQHWDGTRELASLAVKPAYQGQQIGIVLIQAILEQESQRATTDLYLLCLAKLEGYYSRFSFTTLQPKDAPRSLRYLVQFANFLANRFGEERILVMKRRM